MALIAASCGACTRRSAPAPPLVPDVSGTFEIAGLAEPVRIMRDRWGVPHIDARTRDDLFFAQGYVQAQDRLFQMDLWRRSALGRLAEVLGPNFAERDAMTRRIQYAGDAAAEWASYGQETKAIVTAFVRGINAWVARARQRPPEEFVLAGWLPDLWSPDDLLNRTDAFAATGDAMEEVLRARVVAAIGARLAAAVLPKEPALDLPRALDPSVVSPVVADAIRSIGARPFFLGLATSPRSPARPDSTDADPVRGDIPLDVRTATIPSLTYLVHLRAPGWNVIGATAPWLPGVAIGHNERVTWNADGVDVDSQDVFVERMNPSSPHQVDNHGTWIATVLVKEPLLIRRRDKPLLIDRERTSHGAIVAVDGERHLGFAVRWTGADAGALSDLLALELDRATSADAVRSVLARWKVPARRFTFVDVDGRSGSEIAAVVPERRGWNGALPAPAWTGTNDWIGVRRASAPQPPSPLGLLARRYPDRADALIRALRHAAEGPDATRAARAIVVNAIADGLREELGAPTAVVFSHPLAISEATRRRFNVGPLRSHSERPPLFAVVPEPTDWDRSTAMNAPGQAGWPSSPHYADLARRWQEGKAIPLPFTDSAISAAVESTLTLTPVRGSARP